jgi:hypothetical protein
VETVSLRFIVIFLFLKSRDSSVGIALGYRLDDRGSRVAFPEGAGNFSLHHRVQNGSGVHPASYPVATRGSFLEVKRSGHEADHSPPSSGEVKELVELHLHSPITPSWCGARLKHRGNFTTIIIQSTSKFLSGYFLLTFSNKRFVYIYEYYFPLRAIYPSVLNFLIQLP